ncbi:MAG: IS110 family transposase [Nitrospirae bacterium CG_4_9_14_3_um_filter_41_27]|nr:MAG: IS110 family transposase [Nitrospirae bacterium CG_4_9_14_3_um_filter_41_27]
MERENCNRLAEFRQLRKDIRGSDKHLIVGIDVAKERHNAFFGTATGETLYRRLIFDNDKDGFERLLLQAEAMKVQHGLKKVVFGLEPTANYHKPLGEYLIKNGYAVVLVATDAVKKNRSLLDGRWDKNDKKDPANVADLISQGKCLFYEHPRHEVRDLRNLLSFQRKLKKLEHSTRMRIRNHLVAQYFPEMDTCCNWGVNEGLAIVKSCLDPAAISALQYDEFLRKIQTRGVTLAQQRRLSTVWQRAFKSMGCECGLSVEYEARMMVKILEQVRMSIADTQQQIKTICEKFSEYEYLLSIPGFGPDISAKALGAIGYPFRFDNASQVLKLVGLDLSASRSGKNSNNITPSISKKGKSELRYALYQAALIASSKDKHFIAYFTNKLRGREKEKGIKTKMRVKLSAKMMIIAWTLMKKKEFFDPKYLNME